MRLLASLLTAVALLATAAPASALTAVDSTGTTYSTDRVVVPLVFPVIGATSYTDTFLSCRSGCARKHMGQDLMGPKMSPLVAACDGTVVSLKRETTVGQGNYLVIACDHGAGSGWSAFYLHVNNDTPGTDDGKGTKSWSFPTGIALGVRVLAGQLVAWRGDSGNAESTGPHLHFELRKGSGWSGIVYNAYPSLQAARRLASARPSGPHPDGTLIRIPNGDLYLVNGLLKRRVTPGVLAANGLSAAAALPVASGEQARYGTLGPLALRDGALVRDPAGAVWRVLGRTRYPVTPTTGRRVTPVTALDLTGLTVVAAPVSPLTSGVLVRAAGKVYEVGTDGQAHAVGPAAMVSWGWSSADVVDLPADAVLPRIAMPLGLRDGTLVQVLNVGPAVVSGGVIRRIWDPREVTAYHYSGRPRLLVPASLLTGLPVGEIAARPLGSWSR